METYNFDEINWVAQSITSAIGMAIGLGILAVICYFTKKFMDAIPKEFHEFESWQVWLLMIPCWSIVWNFFVFPKMARSYQRLFKFYGVHDKGDCGHGMAMLYCIFSIPPLSCCPLYLIFVIIYLVKTAEYAREAQYLVQQAWEEHQQTQAGGAEIE
jgi:hypothetical protein